MTTSKKPKKDDDTPQTTWITPDEVSGQLDLLKPDAGPKKADWLDDHLEIIGLPDEAAKQFKDRLRREL